MTSDGNLLAPLKCSACGYALASLPAWHTCPECGVPYDPYSRIYTLSLVHEHVSGIISSLGPMLLLLVAWGTLLHAWVVDLRETLILVGCLLILAAKFAYEFHGLLRSIGGVCRVLINHQGIRFEYPHALPLELPWSEFKSARQSLITGNLRVWDQQGRQQLRRRERTIGSLRLRAKLASEFNRLGAIYRDDLRLRVRSRDAANAEAED